MKTSESIANIAAALCKFQASVSNPKKDSINPHFKSKYADLDAIITAIRPALQECGLTFIQNPVRDDQGNIGVYTMILHASGEYIQFDPVFIPVERKGPHQVGAAMTYARRYSLGAAFGIATDEDDDANSITPTQQQKPQQKPQPQKQAPAPQAVQTELLTKEEFPASESQIRAICAIARRKGMSEQQRDEFIYQLTGKESKKDLSMDEASKVIEALQAMKGGAA